MSTFILPLAVDYFSLNNDGLMRRTVSEKTPFKKCQPSPRSSSFQISHKRLQQLKTNLSNKE